MKATKACTLLLLHRHDCRSTLLLILPHQRQKWQCLPPSYLTINTTAVSTHHLLLQPLQICRSRRWDSNAESFRTQNFNYNFDDDDEFESDDSLEQWDELLEDYIDSIWIIKVFRSYGWMLPAVILSLLLASGPKAFLMALAVPLGQSTFAFAIQRMWGERQNGPKHRKKAKKKSRFQSSTVRFGEEDRVGSQGNKKVKMGYQSWVSQNDVSTDSSNRDAPSFGGWDELDKGSEFDVGSPRSSVQTAGRSNKGPSEKGRFSSRMRKSDAPLLLRLLIAVFPFLGSWTKML